MLQCLFLKEEKKQKKVLTSYMKLNRYSAGKRAQGTVREAN